MILINRPGEKRSAFVIAAVLVLVTTAVYWQVRDHAFIRYDDTEFIVQNERIQSGLTTPRNTVNP